MTFVMLAIGRAALRSCWYRICPPPRSISTAADASTLGTGMGSAGTDSRDRNGEGDPFGGTGVGGGAIAGPSARSAVTCASRISSGRTAAALAAAVRLTRSAGGRAGSCGGEPA